LEVSKNVSAKCVRLLSHAKWSRQVRLESLGAENIQGTCAYLSANMWGSALEGGGEGEISLPLLHLPISNGVTPPEEKS